MSVLCCSHQLHCVQTCSERRWCEADAGDMADLEGSTLCGWQLTGALQKELWKCRLDWLFNLLSVKVERSILKNLLRGIMPVLPTFHKPFSGSTHERSNYSQTPWGTTSRHLATSLPWHWLLLFSKWQSRATGSRWNLLMPMLLELDSRRQSFCFLS